MNTTANIDFNKMIKHYEDVLNVCNKVLNELAHPEIYGICIERCNCIVIDEERLMTITAENGYTKHEFSPLYPSYFSRETAQDIVENDIYRNVKGERIQLKIIGKKRYYELLKAEAETAINLFKQYV